MDQSVVMHLGLHGEDHPLSGQGRGPWRGVAGTRRWEGTEQGQDGRGAGGGSDRHLRRLWSCSSSSVNECCSSNWPVAEKAVTVPCGRWKVNWYVASKREKISANNDAVA